MDATPRSIRPFIGAKDFALSRKFYSDLGFTEVVLGNTMSLFRMGDFGFYLQDAYVKDWIDNTMVFLEVENLDKWLGKVKAYQLPDKYEHVRLSEIHYNEWGNEFFLHDPSGILWHIGEFKK